MPDSQDRHCEFANAPYGNCQNCLARYSQIQAYSAADLYNCTADHVKSFNVQIVAFSSLDFQTGTTKFFCFGKQNLGIHSLLHLCNLMHRTLMSSAGPLIVHGQEANQPLL